MAGGRVRISPGGVKSVSPTGHFSFFADDETGKDARIGTQDHQSCGSDGQ
jgi:D-lyxose ketol-isomerase